jgi:hypothetical protein
MGTRTDIVDEHENSESTQLCLAIKRKDQRDRGVVVIAGYKKVGDERWYWKGMLPNFKNAEIFTFPIFLIVVH